MAAVTICSDFGAWLIAPFLVPSWEDVSVFPLESFSEHKPWLWGGPSTELYPLRVSPLPLGESFLTWAVVSCWHHSQSPFSDVPFSNPPPPPPRLHFQCHHLSPAWLQPPLSVLCLALTCEHSCPDDRFRMWIGTSHSDALNHSGASPEAFWLCFLSIASHPALPVTSPQALPIMSPWHLTLFKSLRGGACPLWSELRIQDLVCRRYLIKTYWVNEWWVNTGLVHQGRDKCIYY